MATPFGGFSAETLETYQKSIVEKTGVDFAEGDSYDFTRCIRKDGSAYGTGGKCRKGSEEVKKEDDKKDKLTSAVLKKLKTKAENHALGSVDQTRETMGEAGLSMSWEKSKSGAWKLIMSEEGDEWQSGDSANFATISPKGRLSLHNPYG